MPDEADLADLHVEARMEVGLAANAKLLKPEHHPEFDGQHCVTCGDEMPAARLAMGRVRCTACQAEIENRLKRR